MSAAAARLRYWGSIKIIDAQFGEIGDQPQRVLKTEVSIELQPIRGGWNARSGHEKWHRLLAREVSQRRLPDPLRFPPAPFLPASVYATRERGSRACHPTSGNGPPIHAP